MKPARHSCGLIYALVIASLIVTAVALALMAGRALAAEPRMPDFNLKPLWEFLPTDKLSNISLSVCLSPIGATAGRAISDRSRRIRCRASR
jgi:hypothetical protein